ncbi:MAG: helix-turn-helix transcriptional regulator [Candidatus Riflebacteria bacterium]|nr:helix-turn-helix transcriptional regulator [Candidatus Riflebacteria bacterium]
MKTTTTEQLGTVIRTRRRQLKITQKELAMTCGTGLRFIVDLEKGKPTCQIGKTLQVLQSLGLAIETTILGGDEKEGRRP